MSLRYRFTCASSASTLDASSLISAAKRSAGSCHCSGTATVGGHVCVARIANVSTQHALISPEAGAMALRTTRSTRSRKRSLATPGAAGAVIAWNFWATCLASDMQGNESGPSIPSGVSEKDFTASGGITLPSYGETSSLTLHRWYSRARSCCGVVYPIRTRNLTTRPSR